MNRVKIILAWCLAAAAGCGKQTAPQVQETTDSLPPPILDAALAGRLIQLSLDCVEREYPNKPGHILDQPEQARPHRQDTPVFFGCFDWHSAVHGHWSLARVLRLFPQLPQSQQIKEGSS